MNTLIVTFYAYKGGTGRTLALANVARFLADELGYRVGLIDLDLESPGLVHEPLCEGLDSDDGRRAELLRRIDGKLGFMECYLARASGLPAAHFEMSDYTLALSSGLGGGLVLMPASQGSVTKSLSYQSTLASFIDALSTTGGISNENGSRDVFADLNVAGQITSDIIKELSEGFELDMILLDGRTGTGPFFSPVYTYSMPHVLVLMSGLNDQNVKGAISTLQTTDEGASEEVPVLFVISPVPTVGPSSLEDRLHFVASELARARSERLPTESYRYNLPAQIDHALPYSDAAAFGEVYFPGRYPNSLLARAYKHLAQDLADRVISVRKNDLADRMQEAAVSHGRSIRIAFESIHTDIMTSAYEHVTPETYISEDERSPWQRLLSATEETAKSEIFLQELPDVLVLPQTHLQSLSNRPGGKLLYDLNQMRGIAKRPHRALNLEFLDGYYLNWRHWCSNDKALAGLPFSVNAMLLAISGSKLTPICDHYWRDRGQQLGEPFFVPSNWSALVGLLEAGIRHGVPREEIFCIGGSDRGLYFDWLNYVASSGGFDVIQSEGRLSQVVALERHETIEATKAFLRLAKNCGRAASMDKLVTLFATKRLAMYVGWTDSFRFRHDANGVANVSVAASGERQDILTSEMPGDIRLGYVPRDMCYPRSTLTDGWLMTFPAKRGRSPEHLDQVLDFADRFLEPREQRRLLRLGFPSPSAWAVEQELTALYVERLKMRHNNRTSDSSPRAHTARSFEVFLETLRLAILSGKWVASAKSKHPIDETIGKALKRSYYDIRSVGTELSSIAKEIRAAELGVEVSI